MRQPWLWLPPKIAHDILPWALPFAACLTPSQAHIYRPKKWRHLEFKNPVGIAGGVDKSGKTLLAWQKFGCGFLEVGTVTPRPQHANPGRILDRSISQQAVWNKMGFPNHGSEALKNRLENIKAKIHVPLFVNIGKNRDTENNQAHQDYIHCIGALKNYADVFVINISSPNTKGLRDLLSQDYLSSFIGPIIEYKKAQNIQTPLIMKLSPDMQSTELETVLDTSLKMGIDGWILTNTTASRPAGIAFPQEGGLSGAPLTEKSRENLRACLEYLGPRKADRLVISAGGIGSPQEAQERLKMGADLLQLYSALIFQGPWLIKKIASSLESK